MMPRISSTERSTCVSFWIGLVWSLTAGNAYSNYPEATDLIYWIFFLFKQAFNYGQCPISQKINTRCRGARYRTLLKKTPSIEWGVPRTTTHLDQNYRPLVLCRNVLYTGGNSNSVPLCQYYVMVFTTVLLVQVVRHTTKILQRYCIRGFYVFKLFCCIILSYYRCKQTLFLFLVHK